MESPKSNLDWALYYRSIGWNPIPVDGKTARFAWKEFQTQHVSEEQIKRWWTQWPDAGIAIITGKISDIAVVDIDLGGKVDGLIPTIISSTGGGGKHCIYKYPAEGIGCATAILEKVDFRGEGGYIVAPPSLHSSGKRYEWVIGPGSSDLAELPDHIALLVRREDPQRKDWTKVISGVAEGTRNTDAASYAGKLLREINPDLWDSTGFDAFSKWNERNTPPLSNQELIGVWKSIRDRESKNHTSNVLKDLYRKDKSKALYKIAKHIVDKYSVKTIDDKMRAIYIYDKGVYTEGTNIVGAEVQTILEELSSSNAKREVMEKIKDFTLVSREVFTVDDNFINVNNGVLSLIDSKLSEHDRTFPFLTKIPVDYLEGKDCPKIRKFLSEVLDPEYVPVIQEWAGYLLYRRYLLKKALILVGERNTGKTTLINLLVKFMGESNTTGVSLQRISSDKFATSQLYAKHLNYYDDLSAKDINDNGVFKIATGGGYITGERKFESQFQFRNYAKLTFACNKIPNVADTNDDAYFSRWIIVPFNKQLDQQNKYLVDEITSPEEMSGFLNFALEGLQRLLKQEAFSYRKDPDEIKTEMLRSGSPVANFVYDCLVEEQGHWMSKDEMHQAYKRYVEERNLPMIQIETLGKKLTKYAPYVINSKQFSITGWRNAAFKEDSEAGIAEFS